MNVAGMTAEANRARGMMNSAALAPQLEERSPLWQAVDRIEAALGNLDSAVTRLEGRISPVLGSMPPEKDPGPPAGGPIVESEFGRNLLALACAVHDIAARVDSMSRRVEV